jgi:hypothetical protein
VVVWAIDAAGNTGNATEVMWEVDANSPVTSIQVCCRVGALAGAVIVVACCA